MEKFGFCVRVSHGAAARENRLRPSHSFGEGLSFWIGNCENASSVNIFTLLSTTWAGAMNAAIVVWAYYKTSIFRDAQLRNKHTEDF